MLREKTVTVSLVSALIMFHSGLQHWVRCVLSAGCAGSTTGRANDGEICFSGPARSGDEALHSDFEKKKKIQARVTDRALVSPPPKQPGTL